MGSSDFSLGLALGSFPIEVAAGIGVISLLGDRGDVEHAVDVPVASKVEPVLG